MAYRYLGNKARISDWIGDIVEKTLPQGAVIADPMCGTATMSETFAKRGMTVIASDQLRFPVLHAKARLLDVDKLDFNVIATSYENALHILNNLPPQKGFFWNEYSDEGTPVNGAKPRKYFTGENAAKIDAIRAKIKEWRRDGLEDDACDLLLHDLIFTINDVANIAGTYGYYRSSWNKSSLKPLFLAPTISNGFSSNHSVLQGNVEQIAAQINAEACYLDPPYTKRQYAGNYHILETIAQEDEPTPAGEGGLRNWMPQASNFCYKRHAKKAFRETLEQLKVKWVFLSYSEDGHVTSEDLLSLLSEFGNVKKVEMPLERYSSNSGGNKASTVQEHLYILEKNVD